MRCKVCNNYTTYFASAVIVGVGEVKYYRCNNCGFLKTEEPYWLEKAYSRPINISDTGIMVRNIYNACITSSIIRLCFSTRGSYVDYGGGYGIFVRMMRDRGFDFYRDDKYCTNLFANGFDVSDASIKNKFELLTAFEVFEHFVSPVDEVEALLDKSDNILFSTEILPDPVPQLTDWWYYGLDHGQHISFYTYPCLQILANKFGLNYYHTGNMHLFIRGKRTCSGLLFKLATSRYAIKFNRMFSRNKSLTHCDYKKITGMEIDNK